jgi:hypothetical protein
MSELIRLELKYCERCGGLLLRRSGLNRTFCQPCQRVENDLPPLRPARAQKRTDAPGVLIPFRPASIKPTPDFQACSEGDLA